MYTYFVIIIYIIIVIITIILFFFNTTSHWGRIQQMNSSGDLCWGVDALFHIYHTGFELTVRETRFAIRFDNFAEHFFPDFRGIHESIFNSQT